jgi:drug/metabolite transporter (DMT)-like permease
MSREEVILGSNAHARGARPSALPYLALAVGAFALGFSALFVRWANAPGPVTGAYRMGLASLALLPLAIRSGRSRPWPRRGVLLAILAGTSLALDIAFWNTSVNMTKAANAALFGNTAPLWVALAGWALFHERLPLLFWLGLGATLAGAATVAGSDFLAHPSLGWGDVLGLLADRKSVV